MCRSRRELSSEYLLAKIGVDTAENEPLEVWGENIQYYSFVSLLKNSGEGQRAPMICPQIPVPLGFDTARRTLAEGAVLRSAFRQPRNLFFYKHFF